MPPLRKYVDSKNPDGPTRPPSPFLWMLHTAGIREPASMHLEQALLWINGREEYTEVRRRLIVGHMLVIPEWCKEIRGIIADAQKDKKLALFMSLTDTMRRYESRLMNDIQRTVTDMIGDELSPEDTMLVTLALTDNLPAVKLLLDRGTYTPYSIGVARYAHRIPLTKECDELLRTQYDFAKLAGFVSVPPAESNDATISIRPPIASQPASVAHSAKIVREERESRPASELKRQCGEIQLTFRPVFRCTVAPAVTDNVCDNVIPTSSDDYADILSDVDLAISMSTSSESLYDDASDECLKNPLFVSLDEAYTVDTQPFVPVLSQEHVCAPVCTFPSVDDAIAELSKYWDDTPLVGWIDL